MVVLIPSKVTASWWPTDDAPELATFQRVVSVNTVMALHQFEKSCMLYNTPHTIYVNITERFSVLYN